MKNPFKSHYKRLQVLSNGYGEPLKCLGLILALGLFSISQAAAETLDGDAVKKLALQGMWVSDDKNYGNWSWNQDNSVCLRLVTKKGDCADTGTWKIDGNLICYKLSWWGKSYDINSQCVSIKTLGNGRYEALYDGGAMVSTFIKFTVSDQ